MIHNRWRLLALGAAIFATVPSMGQERTAMRVTIGGVDVPAAAQMRAIVEHQRGVDDEARIKVSGLGGLAYAATLALGDLVEIDAFALEGTPVAVFKGELVSIEPAFDQGQPAMVIRATGASRGEPATTAPFALDPRPGGDAPLLAFAPRLSATSSIQEVLVIGFDGSTGATLTGLATAPTLQLGATGSDAPFGSRLTIDAGRAFASADEANAFAARLLDELLASRISAEAVTTGIPDLRVGAPIEIHGAGTQFNGAYVITGVSHRFGGDSYGGYSSSLRLHRADHGMFQLPEIDDEVLIAFEHGDLSRPKVIDSLWSCEGTRPAGRSGDDAECRVLRWPW